ncbi:MAG: RNase adapter RapZ [Bacteroidota bacterium]
MQEKNNPQKLIESLFAKLAGNDPERMEELPSSGSARKYFRIFHQGKTFIGAWNSDVRENKAFIEFTKHFKRNGLAVPQLISSDISGLAYLLEDLGDETLFSYLTKNSSGSDFPEGMTALYKTVLEALTGFQVSASEGLDYSYCYPRAAFDKQSMMWDLNYFKYYFLKLAGIPFDEQKLEDDFEKFTEILMDAGCDHFLYRDFQSRNIMIHDEKLFFIDYQGGRKGALQYDVASLLYDAKADIPQHVRNELLEHYIVCLKKIMPVDRDKFVRHFYNYVFIRIMQAMGAYGFRGYYEKKAHFLQSIPYAISNLNYLIYGPGLPHGLPELQKVLLSITRSEKLKEFSAKKSDKLVVEVCSFSYKNGLPADNSGNGGGFIFDCRALPNPGRYKEYQSLTGKDAEVKSFLENDAEAEAFWKSVSALLEQSVSNYLERKFSHLSVSFGCTGGQHRSVYFAERLSAWLKNKYEIIVVLKHREFPEI